MFVSSPGHTPKTRAAKLFLALVLLTGVFTSLAQADLQARLDTLLRHEDVYPWKVSVKAVDLSTGRIIFASRDTRALIPASNMKLIVTAAAVDRWGADYEFVTYLARKGKDLVLIGSGDPGFADPALQVKYNRDPTTVFRNWARKVKRSGITEVTNIIVDDTIFDRQFIHRDWPKKQLNRTYTPPVGGLNLWENLASVKKHGRTSTGQLQLLVEPWVSYLPKDKRPPEEFRQVWVSGGPKSGDGYAGGVNSSTGVDDPGIFFGSVFKAVLAKQGILMTGDLLRRSVTSAHGQLDADVIVLDQASTKLTDIIGRANKLSRALCAESLLKRLGAKPGRQGSWSSGIAAVWEFLKDVPSENLDQFVMYDGSGLSRKNRVSPALIVDVLEYMYKGHDAEAFRNSLSIWGRDGTLRKRPRTSALAGRVLAKTGYISGVRSLSGYVQTKRGQWIAFSILMNEVPPGHGGRAWQLRTDICELLVNY